MADTSRRLIDELEIRNVLARIAQTSDDAPLEEYMTFFHEDAVWGGGGFGERRGKAAILEGARERRAEGISGPGAHTRHVLTTSWVDVRGDEASARSVFLFYGETHAIPELRIMGVWEDRLLRTDDGWKLAHRTIVRDPE